MKNVLIVVLTVLLTAAIAFSMVSCCAYCRNSNSSEIVHRIPRVKP